MAGCRTQAAVRPSHLLITVQLPVSICAYFRVLVAFHGSRAERDHILRFLPAACGVNFTSGFTSAVNELAFGSNHSFGDACGRCFQITPTADPFNSSFQGPFGNTIIVKVNNLCLNGPTSQHNWCGQTVSKPKNEFNASMQCVLTFQLGHCSMLTAKPIVALIFVTSRELLRLSSLLAVSR